MGLIGEEFYRSLPATVFPAKQAHSLSPSLRGYQRERYIEAGKRAFDNAGCSAEAKSRGDSLAGHGMDTLDNGLRLFGYM